MHTHRTTSATPHLLLALCLLAPGLHAQTTITFPGGHPVNDGDTLRFNDYTTNPADTVNITGSTSNTIDLATGAAVANLYLGGTGSYGLTGAGITTSGTLILGYLNTAYAPFTGTLDLTRLTGANTFAGGINLNSGALRAASIAQLGITTLNNLKFTGASGALIAAGGMTFDDNYTGANRLILANAKATIIAETGATFAINHSNDTATMVSGSGGGAIYLGANSTLALTGSGGGGFLFDSNTTATGRGGAINLNGANSVAFIDSATFTNNSNGTGQTNGGAIALGVATSTLTIRDSVFKDNKTSPNIANGSGGAINNQAGVLLATNILFQSNTANQGGAFMNASALASTFLTSTFMGNIATTQANGGGAIFNNNASASISCTGVLFLSNTALAGGGGAYTTTVGNTINFTNTSFLDNYAATNGGAIFINNGTNATINFTNASFLDNYATANGGAIFSNGPNVTINFNVTAGATSRLAGNTSGAAATPNSIYYSVTANSTGSLSINVAAGGVLDMLDPFSFNLAANGAGITIAKTGAGTWKLSGTSVITKQGQTATGTASLTISSGTLYLYRDGEEIYDSITARTYYSTAASINLQNGNTANTNMGAYFRLASGANLSIGGGNTISITTIAGATDTNYPNARITFDPGSIITFDLARATPAPAGSSSALLTISAPATFPLANINLITAGALNPALNLLLVTDPADMLGNTYNLLTVIAGSSGAGVLGSLTNFTALIQNATYGGLSYTDFIDAYDYRVKSGVTNNTLWISFLQPLSGNSVITWTGAAGNTWNGNNWATADSDIPFTAGDLINLADSPTLAATTITVDTPAAIFGMYVSGTASYTITGDTIIAASSIDNSTLADQPATTNQLVLGAKASNDAATIATIPYTGTLTLSNTSGNFAGGIIINTGALIGNDRTLGSGTAGILNNGTLAFDQAASGAYAAPITGAGALIKTNTGALTLSANNAAFAGTTTINAGRLILAAGATLGGTINVNATGALGGAGAAAGDVTVHTGGALMAGLTHANAGNAAPGVLAIGGALTLNTGAILQYDLFAGNQSDLITTGALAATGGPASVAIELGSAFSGTYTLLASTGAFNASIDTFTATLASGGPVAGRTQATFDIAGSSLLLKILTSNTTLLWNGASNPVWDNNQAVAWTGGDTHFIAGDSVTFDDTAPAANRTITLAAGIVTSGITVDTAGTYTFTGTGSIATTLLGADLSGATAKLIKTGAGTLNLQNTAANNFTGGIDLNAGAIAFTNGAQLAGGSIHFTGDAALRANATTTLANNLAINAGKTATIDTGANTLTHTGVIASSGALAKTGPGALTLTADSSSSTGATLINQGILVLSTGAALGGSINIATSATLAGGGSATGTVNAAASSVIAPGALFSSTPATLAIGSLNLDSSILRFNLYSGGASDAIHLTGALAIAGINTVDINAFQSGTFNLGNIGALAAATAGSQVTIAGATQTAGARQYATLVQGGADLLLIGTADISRILYWTGATGSTWNTADNNFTDNETAPVTLYAAGDRVIFDDSAAAAAPLAITIATTGVTLSDMIVTGTSNYTFGGGGITANSASVISGSVITTGAGKLRKDGSGTLALNTTANNFLGGIEIHEGAITFTNGAQLGDGGTGAGILFTGDSKLAAASSAQTINSNITVAAGVTGTIDAGANTLTLAGALAGTGTLAKTGAGNLALTGASTGSNAASLTLAITAGTLTLSAAAFDGAIDLAAGTRLSSSEANSTGTILASAGSVLEIASGTLNAASLQLAESSTLAGAAGVLTGAATLNGMVHTATTGALTLAATITGTGAFIKDGAGTLQFAGADSLRFTGTSQLNAGITGITGISAAAPSVTQNFILNGGTLAFGAGTGTAGLISSANDWRGINIIPGDNIAASAIAGDNDIIHVGSGTIAFALRAGLHIAVNAGAGGITTFSNTANNYYGLVRVDSGTFLISSTNPAQLGTATSNVSKVSLNGGALEIAASITTAGALELAASGSVTTGGGVSSQWGGINVSGTGQYTFTKLGSGTLTIAGASNAAALNVAGGRYATTHAQGAGSGPVTVANGATIEFRPADNATVPNNFTGSGTLLISSGLNTYSGTSIATGHIVIQGAGTSITSVNARHPIALGAPGGTIRIDAARLNLGAPSTTLGNVILASNARLAFVSDTTGASFKTATLSSLAGNGTLMLNTNIDKALADRLDILDSLDGNYTLHLANAGGTPVDYIAPITLISAPLESTGTFTLPGGKLDVSLFTYGITTETSGGSLEITLTRLGSLSNSASFITSMAAALPLSWFSELHSVNQRMGELRFEDRSGAGAAGWMRGYSEKINYNDKITGAPFGERRDSGEAGFDYKVGGTKNNVYVGGFIGYGQSRRDYSDAGDGSSESVFGGLYQIMIFKSGWYIGTVFKADVFTNRFTAFTPPDENVTASYRSWAAGLSFEVGKHCDLGRGWFIEPQMQGAFAILKDKTYTTSNGMIIDMTFCTVARGRAGFMFGRSIKSAAGFGAINAYVKAYAGGQSTSGSQLDVSLSNGRTVRFTPVIKGGSIEGGFGISWLLTKSTRIYFDYEATKAEYYTKPWGVNLGIRYCW